MGKGVVGGKFVSPRVEKSRRALPRICQFGRGHSKAGFTLAITRRYGAQVEIGVISNDGKRTERILIAPGTGGKFIAKREGEAAMYEIEGNAVAELRGVAADVKEEAAKPADKKK